MTKNRSTPDIIEIYQEIHQAINSPEGINWDILLKYLQHDTFKSALLSVLRDLGDQGYNIFLELVKYEFNKEQLPTLLFKRIIDAKQYFNKTNFSDILKIYAPLLTQLNYNHILQLLEEPVFIDILKADDTIYREVIEAISIYLDYLENQVMEGNILSFSVLNELAKLYSLLIEINKPIPYNLISQFRTFLGESFDYAGSKESTQGLYAYVSLLEKVKEIFDKLNVSSLDQSLYNSFISEITQIQNAEKNEQYDIIEGKMLFLLNLLNSIFELVVESLLYAQIIKDFENYLLSIEPSLNKIIPFSKHNIDFSELKSFIKNFVSIDCKYVTKKVPSLYINISFGESSNIFYIDEETIVNNFITEFFAYIKETSDVLLSQTSFMRKYLLPYVSKLIGSIELKPYSLNIPSIQVMRPKKFYEEILNILGEYITPGYEVGIRDLSKMIDFISARPYLLKKILYDPTFASLIRSIPNYMMYYGEGIPEVEALKRLYDIYTQHSKIDMQEAITLNKQLEEFLKK